MIGFRVDVYTDEYLPDGVTDTDALLTVCAEDDGAPGEPGVEHVEVIVIDCSGSMSTPATKIYAARRAACAAVDGLRPGTLFAVIRGTGTAQVVYPPGGGLARAAAETRDQARRTINRMSAAGGTAIGSWLLAARDLFAGHPDAVRHAILLTDGRNEHESAADFADALAACREHFQCDSRGVGRGWVAAELTAVSDTLLGTARDIADPADLVADFQAMTKAAMARALPAVSLRVWIPHGARISTFKQVHPTLEDLLERGTAVGGQETEFPTGAWGAGCRDYHLSVSGLLPHRITRPSRLARIAVVTDGRRLAGGDIQAMWTADEQLHTQVSREVRHSRGVIDLAEAIRLGMAARGRGDLAAAGAHLGRALDLARASHDQATTEILEQVVEADPAGGAPAGGAPWVRPDVDPHLFEVLEVRYRFTRALEPRTAR